MNKLVLRAFRESILLRERLGPYGRVYITIITLKTYFASNTKLKEEKYQTKVIVKKNVTSASRINKVF